MGAPEQGLGGASNWTLLSSLGLEGGEGLSVGRGSPTSHPYSSASQVAHLASQKIASSGCEPLPEVMVYLDGIEEKGYFGHLCLTGQMNYITFSRLGMQTSFFSNINFIEQHTERCCDCSTIHSTCPPQVK